MASQTHRASGGLTGTPLPKLPSQHAMHEDGPPMEGLLRAIRRLDHSPVRVEADELATGDIPQQPGAAQSAERALPVAAEQAHGVPAGRGGARGPVLHGGHEGLAIADKLLPLVRRYISRCSAEVETGNASDPLQENRVAFQTVVWGMVSKQVMIVGSGMVRIDDQGRHLRNSDLP